MTPARIILASASPRRVELLRTLGLPFDVVVSAAEESEEEALGPEAVAIENARRKARVVAASRPEALVIGADTVVALGQKLLGKPRDAREAESFLHDLSGRTHLVITGVCLIRGGSESCFAETTRVTFKALSLETIREYIRLVHVLDKAGGYAVQEHGGRIIERVDGSRSNVIGLPLEALAARLNALGFTAATPSTS